jgi:DNA-binding MarR family transcriptional regulator
LANRTTTRRQPLGTLATDLRLACMRISRRIRLESGDVVAPHQFSVLARLEESARTLGELAARERVSAPSMTRTVSALEDLGLVARTSHPDDGRQVVVSLSDHGRTVVRDIRRQRDQWMVVRLAGLDDVERDILRRAAAILARVAAE